MVAVRARVTSKGQITIPKEIRDALALEAGAEVEFELADGGAMMKPADEGFLALFGKFKPRKPIDDWSEVRRETAAWVGRRAAERGRLLDGEAASDERR